MQNKQNFKHLEIKKKAQWKRRGMSFGMFANFWSKQKIKTLIERPQC